MLVGWTEIDMGALERVVVELPQETAEAMRRSVSDGRYQSTEQIVEIALDDWFAAQASDQHRLDWLRAAVREGDESGPSIPAEQVYAELESIIASYENRH